MTEDEYAKIMNEIFIKPYVDEMDKVFLRGMSKLSVRKKNKIKKWVLKALEKEKVEQ